MKLNANQIFVILFFLVSLSPGLIFASRLIWPLINDVRTGETPQYPDLQPQTFARSWEEVFAAALATAQALGWELRLQEAGEGLIEATDTTRWFKFKDDVTITLTRAGNGTVVNVRSKSRVGKGDLGTNAKRIRRFQAELAKRL